MNNHTWQDVALAFIAALPATIAAIAAAISSRENGRKIDSARAESHARERARRVGRN